MTNSRLVIAAAAITSSLAYTHAGAADISIEVRGIDESKGEILVVIFNQAEGWLRKGIATGRTGARVGSVIVQFPNLADGDYAVSVIHDVNGNGKLDSNLIGIPLEPVGFSNGATGKFGPPSFEQAKVKLDGGHKTIGVQLQRVLPFLRN